MSNEPQPQKLQSSLSNPQVLTAIIGGIVTLIAAILGFLPNVLNRPPAATAVIVVTATLPPPTATLVEPTTPPTSVPVIAIEPTDEPAVVVPTATPIPPTATLIPPTATPIPPTPIPPTPVPPTTAPVQPANALLLWDNVSFTALNIGGSGLMFGNVVFRSTGGSFDARVWGSALPSGYCLRLRDATVGPRQPPAECGGNLYSLLEVGGSALFWRNTDTFDVVLNGQVIATCPVAAGRCEVYIG
jgi:hypothetical protein